MENPLIEAQNQQAQNTGSFADRLRDERMAFTNTAQQFVNQITPENPFLGEAGTPLDPSQVYSGRQNLLEAIGKIASQYSPELELQARELEKPQGVSLADRLKAYEMGLSLDESGNIVAGSTEQGSVFLTPKEKIDKESDLRKEVRNELGDLDFKDVRANYDRIVSTEPTPGGDLSMIFAYMKMLDPNSVVRETEQELAEKADSLPGQLRTYALKVSQGRKLNDSQRADFRRQAALVYNSQVKRAKDVSEYYTYEANRFGIDPKSVLGAAGEIEEVEIPESVAKQGGLMQMFGNILEGIPSSPLRTGSFEQDPLDQFYN